MKIKKKQILNIKSINKKEYNPNYFMRMLGYKQEVY